METPWIEKYRPLHLDDVVGNTDIITRLKIIAQEGNLPHLLLAGAPGVGKTTSMLCLAHDLLGSNYKEAVLELNASDDRGLDVVRSKIKFFAQKKVTLPSKAYHKIVILDEADSMTPAAQQALRRTMELYSTTTRFAFACNNSSKIIEPIQSRCAVVRFGRLLGDEMASRMKYVLQQEKVPYTQGGLEAILYIAEGDMRNALNCCQSTFAGFGEVNVDNVFKVCDQPNPELIGNILRLAIQKQDLDGAYKELKRLLGRGYAPADVISSFFKLAQNTTLFSSEEQQLESLKAIGETTAKIADGVGTPLQMTAMLATLCWIARQFSA